MKRLIVFTSLMGLLSCSSLIEKKYTSIKKWGYQLQAYRPPYDLERIQKSKDTLWVIDYSLDGTDSRRFRPDQIELLKSNNNLMISYLSVGEANSFRYYFDKMPKSLVSERNRDWGSLKIRFWEKEWQDMILDTSSRWGKGYLERIIEAGFDGVYLDIVDGFENFPKERKLRAQNMADFILAISKKGKKSNEHFRVIIQNGLHILDLIENPDQFLKAIDGVAIESLFFLGNKPIDNDYNPQKSLYPLIARYQAAGLKILSVEYLTDQSKIDQYFKEARELKIIPLVSSKLLEGALKWPTEQTGKE